MGDDISRSQLTALARRAADGDRLAAEHVLGELYAPVHAVCRRICANLADAEDATQEAMISIARGLRHFDGRAAVTTWAYRIATNAALDELRRRGRRPRPADSAHSPEVVDDTPSGVDRLDDRLDIDAALAGLHDEFRVAVVLRDVVGMEYSEIATDLGVPIGTVRSRIARGRRQLAAVLDLGNQQPAPSVRTDEP